MKKYRIIDIEDSKGGSEGHVIVVKANPGKKEPGFDHLSKMYGKEYFLFSMMEDSETETFVFPFSENLALSLVNQAKLFDKEQKPWEPDEAEFYDASVMINDGIIKPVHKHISFREEIQEIVRYFNFSSSLNTFYENDSKISEVKNVYLSEGTVYSGKAMKLGDLCIPHGYGVKQFNNEDNQRIYSFYKVGSIGNIAMFAYKKYMHIGGVIEGKPNGWGFTLASGQFTFGYYKNGKLYKDLSPFASDVFYSMQGKGLKLGHVNGKINRLVYGLLPNEYISFLGFQFLEDGSVFLGEGSNPNEYDLTGHFLYLKIDGTAQCGYFHKGKIEEEISQREYYEKFTNKSAGVEKIDLSKDFLSKPDSNLYFIVGLRQQTDLDMGPIISINAIPYELLTHTENDIFLDKKDMEYFYLRSEDSLVRSLVAKAETPCLWKVHLDDYHNHFDYVWDMYSEYPLQKNIHLHNGLIGLDYSNIVDFDTVSAMVRHEKEINNGAEELLNNSEDDSFNEDYKNSINRIEELINNDDLPY